MDNEFRFVHREETFNDLAVRELAKSKSACLCRLQFGRCVKSECASCAVHSRFMNCFNAMSDYDKQRLCDCVSDEYIHDSLRPEQWLPYKKMVRRSLKIGLVSLISLTVLFVFVAFIMPSSSPDKTASYDDISLDMHSKIISAMIASHKSVYDLNDDGKINCIDYAVMFKVTWDKMFPDEESRCKIVRNKNGTFHHLFVHIWDEQSQDIEIETMCSNPYMYLMESNWSDRYDSRYNVYGETYRWLREMR